MKTSEELRIRRQERELSIKEARVKAAEDSIDRLLAAALYLRHAADNSSGSGSGSCGGTVTIGVRCLSGLPGYTVTITQGSTTFSAVTGGPGSVTFTPGISGVWGYSVSGPGITTVTGTFTFACVNLSFFVDIPNAFNHTVSGSVKGCNNATLPGATLTLKQGSTTIATATTDSSGNYSINWTAGGTVGYTLYCDYNVLSPARFVQASASVFTTLCQSLNQTLTFLMGPAYVASGYVCDPCGGAIPIKTTLTCTPPFGPPFTITWDGTSVWAGTHYPTYTATEYCAGDYVTQAYPVPWLFGYTVVGGTGYSCSLLYGSAACGAPPPCTIGPHDDELKFGLPAITCADGVNVVALTATSHTNYPFIATFNMPAALGSIGTGTATITE